MKNELIKKAYINSFDMRNNTIKELTIITTKCLIDDNKQRYVHVDNNRLKDELRYHRFYSEKDDVVNILNTLLPLILSNTNLQKSEDEVLSLIEKYIKYLKLDSKRFEYLIGAVFYNSIIHSILENKNIEYEELLQIMKEKLIGFSIELDKKSTIKFQMLRINIIQKIDKYIDLKVDDYESDDIIKSILDILYDVYKDDRNVMSEELKGMKKSILSILGDEIDSVIDNIDFINSMSDYIVKLRNYKVNKVIYNKNSDPRNIISLNQGDTVIDPVLNQITVTSKGFNNNVLIMDVKSKSGNYKFKFIKS